MSPTEESSRCPAKLDEETRISNHILEDLLTWWSWATEECQRAGRVEQLRNRMRHEREAIVEWMNRRKNTNNIVQPDSSQTTRNNQQLSLQMNNNAATDVETPSAPSAPIEDQDLVEWWAMAEGDAKKTGRLEKAAIERKKIRAKVAKMAEERENRLLVATMRQAEARMKSQVKNTSMPSTPTPPNQWVQEIDSADDGWLYGAADELAKAEPMEVDLGQAEQEVEILPRGIKRKLEHLLLGESNLENITSKKIKLDGEGQKQEIHHFNSETHGHNHF